jgi:hypothetical protein
MQRSPISYFGSLPQTLSIPGELSNQRQTGLNEPRPTAMSSAR